MNAMKIPQFLHLSEYKELTLDKNVSVDEIWQNSHPEVASGFETYPPAVLI